MQKSFKMKSMPYAQCRVVIGISNYDNSALAQLWSYNTLVLEIDNVISTLRVHQYAPVNYSPTTARHVNRFTTEFLGRNFYHELKNAPVDFNIPAVEFSLSGGEAIAFMNTVYEYLTA